VTAIHADLTAGDGLNLALAKPLEDNALTAFNGIQKTGPFDIPGDIARQWLGLPNPHNRPNSDVLRPWFNGLDVTRRARDFWIVDYGWEMSEADASFYEQPFAYALKTIKPVRDANSLEALRRDWWRLWRPRPEMRKSIARLQRYIATPEVSKYRVFVWLSSAIVPDKNLVAIARSDDATFGVLHSRFHELWSLRLCTWLGVGNDPRYTPTTTFETFPFPEGLTPRDTAPGGGRGAPPCMAPEVTAANIAAAARRLNELRENWLNPPEWTERIPEAVPGYPDRIVARPGHEAELKKRTLTNLYNARPAWLDNAHRALDAAVAAAYGWHDYTPAMPDEEVLKRLLALNLERKAAESQ
jgi:type II restriction/modification system DNA methylase subunit YeeA